MPESTGNIFQPNTPKFLNHVYDNALLEVTSMVHVLETIRAERLTILGAALDSEKQKKATEHAAQELCILLDLLRGDVKNYAGT